MEILRYMEVKKKLVSFLYLCTCTKLCQHPIIHVISVIFIISVIPVIPIIPVIPVIWSSGHLVILAILLLTVIPVMITCKSLRPTPISPLMLLRRGISKEVPSGESNPGLPYNKLMHYHLSYVAPHPVIPVIWSFW
jgi:hypothetical protein